MRNSTFWRGGILTLLLFSFAISVAFSQERTVTGTVIASEGDETLPGVNIVIQGTTQGAVTDINGNYSVVVPGPDAVLVFSSIGFSTQAITVGNQSVIDVTMDLDVTDLDEVVVTAYATQLKKDLTGSVGVINSEELTAVPQSNVTQQIQGRVAGVTVTQDSRPGQSGKVRIRGYGSFQNNSPLYIVDGVPTGDINTINPDDVESMSVLKDAGAASIYGSRASNGVILITTKKGKGKGVNVNFNMYVGTQNPGSGPDFLLNTQEYGDLQWLVYANDGTVEDHPIYGPSSASSPSFPSWAADTKWFDEAFTSAMIQNYDLSLSGGNENSKYYASFGYFDQDGTTLFNWYKRFSGRFNSEFTIGDRVTIGENMNLVHRSDMGTNANGDENTALMMAVYREQPIIPVKWTADPYQGVTHYFEPGDWGGTGIAPRLGNANNWVAERTRSKDNKWQDIGLMGNIFIDVKIIDGLIFKSSFGGNLNSWYGTGWTGKTYENAENTATSSYNENSGYGGGWNWTNTLTFNRAFGNHNVLAVLGYEATKTGIGRSVTATAADYFSEALSYRTVSNGANKTASGSDYWTPRSLVSQFFRGDYNYRNKYYGSATVRRDGSSVFGSDTRYGIFPSFSAGWRLSEEGFMQGVNFISNLKIRGGWGTMGNQLPVSTDNQFYLYGGSPSTSYYDLNGTTNSSLQGFRPTRIGNPNAQWETNVTTNIGADLALFENKLEIIFDWYSKVNQDLLYNPEIVGTAGAATAPYVNVGEMKNTGIDLTVVYRQIWNNGFSFEIMGTMTTFKNTIVKIADGYPYFDSGGSRIGAFNRNMEGGSMSAFYGYKVEGLFQDAAEVASAPIQDGAEPGFFRYANWDETPNGDGDQEITPDDRGVIGSPIPDFNYGINVVLGYKGFDLTAFFYGTKGNEIFNYNRYWLDFWPSFQGQKSTELLYESWRPDNMGATVPKASNTSNFSTNTVASSYYVEDGSYFRLKSLQIGYTFPKKMLGNVFNNLRIYIQGTNLFTVTKYSGMDPELASFNDTAQGIDEGNLPNVKQFLFGLSFGF